MNSSKLALLMLAMAVGEHYGPSTKSSLSCMTTKSLMLDIKLRFKRDLTGITKYVAELQKRGIETTVSDDDVMFTKDGIQL